MTKTDIKDVTVIWHLGFQKTGTTTFQSFLRRNDAALSEEIAIFPKQHWTQRLQTAGLSYWDDPSLENEKALKGKARAIREKVREQGKTMGLVSDENVIGLNLYDEKGGMIDMAAAIMPILERAISPSRSIFVFYTRNFDSWFKSAHNQCVKQLRCRDNLEDFVEKTPFSTDWDAHQKQLKDAVQSPVIFRDLGEDAKEGLPMGGHILELAGIDRKAFSEFSSPIGRNESLSPAALDFMLEINRSHLHEHGLEIVRTKVLKHPQAFD